MGFIYLSIPYLYMSYSSISNLSHLANLFVLFSLSFLHSFRTWMQKKTLSGKVEKKTFLDFFSFAALPEFEIPSPDGYTKAVTFFWFCLPLCSPSIFMSTHLSLSLSLSPILFKCFVKSAASREKETVLRHLCIFLRSREKRGEERKKRMNKEREINDDGWVLWISSGKFVRETQTNRRTDKRATFWRAGMTNHGTQVFSKHWEQKWKLGSNFGFVFSYFKGS